MPVKPKKHATAKQIQEAILLLTTTEESYKVISEKTKVSPSKVSELGKQFRSAELRDRLMREGRARGKETLIENAHRRLGIQTPEQTEIEVASSQPGTINRKILFDYAVKGDAVPVDDFLQELHSLILTLEESGDSLVTFDLSVQAK